MRSAGGGVRRASLVVGREVELDHLLRGVRTRAERATPGCVFVVGEGGVGKTRLLAEIAAESRQLGLAVLSGRAPVTTPVAFSVVAEALRSWLRANADPRRCPRSTRGCALVLPEWPGDDPPASGLSDAQLRLLALEGVVRLVAAHRRRWQRARSCCSTICTPPTPTASRPFAISRPPPAAASCSSPRLRSREGTLAEQVVRALAPRRRRRRVRPRTARADARSTDLLGALLDCEPPRELVDDVCRAPTASRSSSKRCSKRTCGPARSTSAPTARAGAAVSPPVSRTVRDMVEARLDRLANVAPRRRHRGGRARRLRDRAARRGRAAVGRDASATRSRRRSKRGLVETRRRGESRSGTRSFAKRCSTCALPHVRAALHTRAAAALAAGRRSDATTLERRADHLEPRSAMHDEAAALLAAAPRLRLDEHALLSAEALARRARELARDPAVRSAAADALARVLARAGPVDRRARARRSRRPRARPGSDRRRRDGDVRGRGRAARGRAQPLVAQALADGDDSAAIHVLAGRVAMADGRADDALAAAERALTRRDCRRRRGGPLRRARRAGAGARLRGPARRSPQGVGAAGRRGRGRRPHRRSRPRGRAARQARSIRRGHARPAVRGGRDRERRGRARRAGVGRGEPRHRAHRSRATRQPGHESSTTRSHGAATLRLDQLPYLLAGARRCGGVARRPRRRRRAPRRGRAARADRRPRDPHVGIRADAALDRGPLRRRASRCTSTAWSSCGASPGGMPSDSPCWLVWAYAVVGRRDDAEPR